jgi:hypothetical protein
LQPHLKNVAICYIYTRLQPPTELQSDSVMLWSFFFFELVFFADAFTCVFLQLFFLQLFFCICPFLKHI